MDWPDHFRPQIFFGRHIKACASLVAKDVSNIHAYFASHPDEAYALLQESYDKRWTPSTFIQEHKGGYRVGWFEGSYQCTQQFPSLAEAATDYVLFSYGVGRYSVPR